MTITTSFDRNRYIATTEAILEEWSQTYFPAASYRITFEPPQNPTKHTIWMQELPGTNRALRERTGGTSSRTTQGKELRFAVSMLSKDRATVVAMAESFERAVLASSSLLGAAGLRYARVTPFQDIIEGGQPNAYRRTGILSLTVEI